ncbi:hypothetical protein KKF05_00920 [Patescibacteria group bacterium]|nr:hypothetical protein [Patescibacteria group bacterium]MBU1029019.1 hypothetical protein [Patescibacteria group bacterium]MBU1915855.1 hypothetical protein [Patescibacteria group bacterium]
MSVKQMKLDAGFCQAGCYRGPLEIVDGYVVRFVFEGEPTVYIYGLSFVDMVTAVDLAMVEVHEVISPADRAVVRQLIAERCEVCINNVVWATF